MHSRLAAYDASIFDLGLSLSPLYQRGFASFADLLGAILTARNEVMGCGRQDEDGHENEDEEGPCQDWPSTVGVFLGAVQRHMRRPPLPLRPADAAAVSWEGLHVHTVSSCAEDLLLLV
eukprot:5482961-Prymnesium_polylepis.1